MYCFGNLNEPRVVGESLRSSIPSVDLGLGLVSGLLVKALELVGGVVLGPADDGFGAGGVDEGLLGF